MKDFRSEGSTYEIEYKAGEGLTAEVFKAYRIDSRRFSRQAVALKILKKGTAVPHLRREFETLAQVTSPHCVRVLAWENTADRSALALEWIDGATLLEVAQCEDFDNELVDELISQVQTGLSDLSSHGLHHGDLHPKNILIDLHGVIRLVDFASVQACNGVIQGSPPYLAPEIWSGGDTSLSCDLFSLNLIATDTRNGFRSVPIGREHAKARALQVQKAREFLPVQSQRKVRERLSQIVHVAMQKRTSAHVATEVFQETDRRRLFLRESAAAFALSTAIATSIAIIAIPVRAEAPLFARNLARAELSIRTNHWFQVALNGQDLGYAPIAIHNLASGPHRLSWRSAQGGGTIKLDLKTGESRSLSDRDFHVE